MEIGERIVLKVSDPKWGIKKRPAPAIFLGEEGEGPGREGLLCRGPRVKGCCAEALA